MPDLKSNKLGLVINGQPTEEGAKIGHEAEAEPLTAVADRHGVSIGTVASLFRKTHNGLSKQEWVNQANGTGRQVGRKRILFEEDGTLSQFGADVLEFLKTHSYQRASREFGLDLGVMRRTVHWVTGTDLRSWRKTLKGPE